MNAPASRLTKATLLAALALLAVAAAMLFLMAAPAAAQGSDSAATIVAGPAIVSSPADGVAYAKGEVVTIAVTYSEAVTVTVNAGHRRPQGPPHRGRRETVGQVQPLCRAGHEASLQLHGPKRRPG